MNIHIANVNFGKLTSSHFFAWRSGLKTGCYYLRTKAAVDAIKFTVDTKVLRDTKTAAADAAAAVTSSSARTQYDETSTVESRAATAAAAAAAQNEASMMCSSDNRDDCMSCGS